MTRSSCCPERFRAACPESICCCPCLSAPGVFTPDVVLAFARALALVQETLSLSNTVSLLFGAMKE